MYLQFDDELNILPATIKIVNNQIMKQFIASFPVFLGLTFFCMSYYGMCWRFNDFDKSMIMLWAMWNGDELQNMYHALSPIKVIMGPVMLYVWVWVSNNLIQNAFLAIVADGYVEQSQTGMFSWLMDDLDDPDDKAAQDLLASDSDEPENTCEDFIQKVKKRQLLRTEALYDNENYKIKKMQIQEVLELEKTNNTGKRI